MKVLQLILNLWGIRTSGYISTPYEFRDLHKSQVLVQRSQKRFLKHQTVGASQPSKKKKNCWNVPEFQLRGSSGLRPRPRTLEPAQLTGSKNDGMRQQDFWGDSTFEEVSSNTFDSKTTIYPSTSKMFILRKVQRKKLP